MKAEFSRHQYHRCEVKIKKIIFFPWGQKKAMNTMKNPFFVTRFQKFSHKYVLAKRRSVVVVYRNIIPVIAVSSKYLPIRYIYIYSSYLGPARQ